MQGLYARWMVRWETALTTRDENRVVRPVEWGFDFLQDFIASAGLEDILTNSPGDEAAMDALNAAIVERSDDFYGYARPDDFVLEERCPQLFPTNVRPETLRRDAELKRKAAAGQMRPVPYLRFTSPVRTGCPASRSRPSWSCRSGTPMLSATMRSVGSSTASAFRRCASVCPTTTFAVRRNWSGPTTP